MDVDHRGLTTRDAGRIFAPISQTASTTITTWMLIHWRSRTLTGLSLSDGNSTWALESKKRDTTTKTATETAQPAPPRPALLPAASQKDSFILDGQ